MIDFALWEQGKVLIRAAGGLLSGMPDLVCEMTIRVFGWRSLRGRLNRSLFFARHEIFQVKRFKISYFGKFFGLEARKGQSGHVQGGGPDARGEQSGGMCSDEVSGFFHACT